MDVGNPSLCRLFACPGQRRAPWGRVGDDTSETGMDTRLTFLDKSFSRRRSEYTCHDPRKQTRIKNAPSPVRFSLGDAAGRLLTSFELLLPLMEALHFPLASALLLLLIIVYLLAIEGSCIASGIYADPGMSHHFGWCCRNTSSTNALIAGAVHVRRLRAALLTA
jgi:hypothetical protein